MTDKRLLIPLFLILVFPGMVSAQPERLASFDTLLSALRAGRPVRVSIEYAKCSLLIDSVAQPAPDAIGGMAVSTYEFFARGVVRNTRAYLVTSETHLIAHHRYGYVYNYVRIRVYEDNAVEIVARYLRPSTYEVVMDETFTGRISNGEDTEGVHFTTLQ